MIDLRPHDIKHYSEINQVGYTTTDTTGTITQEFWGRLLIQINSSIAKLN